MPNEDNKQQILLLAKLAEDLKIELDADIKKIVDNVKPPPAKQFPVLDQYAIMSDVHGNIQAFQAVLADIRARRIPDSRIIFLGDLVGYGGNPVECLQLMQSLNPMIWLKGNHDRDAEIGDMNTSNLYAITSISWTNEVLKKINAQDFASGLLPRNKKEDLFFAHGCPGDDEKQNIDKYIFPEDLELAFSLMDDKEICFVGHTHYPFCSIKDNKGKIITYPAKGNKIDLNKINKAIVNVGSVGQPRDSNNKACYVVLEKTDEKRYIIKFVRVIYDIKGAQTAIKAYWNYACNKYSIGGNLKDSFKLADRLATGT